LDIDDAVAVGFKIIDFSEDAAQAADVDRLTLELAFAINSASKGPDFWVRPTRKGRIRTEPSVPTRADGLAEPIDFSLAGETRWQRTVARAWFP